MTVHSFGRYVVTSRLGRGGMAEVYQAHDPVLDRQVAIKVIHPHLGTEEGFGERFRREARLVASLRHPHIVQLHDFGVADDQPFMVMEYLEGGTLKERLAQERARGKTISLGEIVRLLGRVAGALDYAHAKGAVHRDIKPTNILFTAHGEPVLTDFGIVKILDATLQLSAAGSVLGSPAYMSPEQAASRVVDSRSDLYSLGVVLYEMVTGRVPFEGQSPTAVMMKHLTEPPPPPRQFNPDLPEAVQAVILKALAKNLADRYGSAGELARAFEEAVQSAVTAQAAPPASSEEATLVGRRTIEAATLLDGPPGAPGAAAVLPHPPAASTARWSGAFRRDRLLLVAGGLVLIGLLFVGWQLLGGGGESETASVAGNGEPPTQGPSALAVATTPAPPVRPTAVVEPPVAHPDYLFVRAWGSQGDGPGQFNFPVGIALGNDMVYVTDFDNARVQRFDLDGNYLGRWGGLGSDPGQFQEPKDVAVAPDGSVYVVEMAGARCSISRRPATTSRGGAAWGMARVSSWGPSGSPSTRRAMSTSAIPKPIASRSSTLTAPSSGPSVARKTNRVSSIFSVPPEASK
ncbi:MAG: serine/threonine-protein kinase [Ardenticatenaceae bacterium]|nr:serine/threonine-protein kinase [Ardenticatenaceae bacterium]